MKSNEQQSFLNRPWHLAPTDLHGEKENTTKLECSREAKEGKVDETGMSIILHTHDRMMRRRDQNKNYGLSKKVNVRGSKVANLDLGHVLALGVMLLIVISDTW